jgi:hypothetical protein
MESYRPTTATLATVGSCSLPGHMTEDASDKINDEVDEILAPFETTEEQMKRLKPGVFSDMVRENDAASGKRRHTKWTPEGERLFRDLYMQGKNPNELSKLFGICRASAYSKVQNLGLAEERARLEQAVNVKLAAVADELAAKSEDQLAKIDHSKFIEKCTLWSERAMTRAGNYITSSSDAKQLLSAVNALKNAAELYRKTHRMDSGPAHGGNASFNFFMGASTAADPLTRARRVEPLAS